MKICFLCNALEPGRDGVGDYTRLLAKACQAAGHTVELFALRDPYAAPDDTHRFSNALESPSEQATFLAQLKSFAPDWVSLQFVPYGLHPKGLPRHLSKLLRAARGPWRWHVMFHEIWIGCKLGAPLKERLIGHAQRRIIAKAMREIQPLAHTHAEPYRQLLKHIGLEAQTLPLFSNLPISPPDAGAELNAFLAAQGLALPPQDITTRPGKRKALLIGGMFGTVHPQWPPQPLLSELRAAARRTQRRIVVVHLGDIGPGEKLWHDLMQGNDEHLTLLERGRLDAEAASRLIQSLDFGLTSTPHSLLQKSGSTAALLEHGVPVIVNRDDAHYPGVPRELPLPDPLLISFNGTLPDDFFELKHGPIGTRLPAVAQTFLNALGA